MSSLISDAALHVLRIITGFVFTALFTLYASALTHYNEFRWPRFTHILVDNMLVAGLTALLQVYLLGGGNSLVRWIVYPFCSDALLKTRHTYLLCPPGADEADCSRRRQVIYSWAYYGMRVCNLVTVLSGFAIAQLTPGSVGQWVVFVLSFIPFLFTILLLRKSVNYNLAQPHPLHDARGFLSFNLFLWLIYPLFFVLSPLMTGLVSNNTAEFFYTAGDWLLKAIDGFVAAWTIRKQCGECVACQPESDKKMEDAGRSLYGNPNMAPPPQQQQQQQQMMNPYSSAPAVYAASPSSPQYY